MNKPRNSEMITIRLPEGMRERVRKMAANKKTTVTRLVTKQLAKKLAKHERAQ